MMREVWVTMWSRLVLAKMLPRVLTRLPIVPQLLQPLEQGQHIGALGQADVVQPRNGPERRRTEKVPQNFGHTIDLWADSV